MARKIRQTQYVDHVTGEIISTEKEFITNNSERFIMLRTTDNLSWDLKFSNIAEYQLVVRMVYLENRSNNNLVALPKQQIEELAVELGVSVSMIRKCLANLVKNDFIKRVERGFYIVNPLRYYQGQSKDVKKRYEEYNGRDKKGYSIKLLNNSELAHSLV